MLPIAHAALPSSGPRSWGAPREGHVHNGVDLHAPRGTDVVAPAAGIVRHAYRQWHQGFTGYGRVVVLEHPGGTHTLFAHLDTVLVEPGELVEAGQQLGTVGTSLFTAEDHTAESGAPHLHFEASARPYPMPSSTGRLDPVQWLLGTIDGARRADAMGGGVALAFALGVTAWLLSRGRRG